MRKIWRNFLHSVIVIILVTDAVTACYKFPVGQKNPCEGNPCDYGAKCVPSIGGTSYRCTCPLRCDTFGDNVGSTPVCGSNGVDYPNMCELHREACHSMTEIRVKYYGECDPCEGFLQCNPPEICQLDKQRKPVCRCSFTCPKDLKPVCGSDGRTYSSKCFLRTEACKSRKEISVLYNGRCSAGSNPCDQIRCGPEEECSVDRQGRASCVCRPPCEPVVRRVCGNDSLTYDSECELHRQSCLRKVYVTMAHTGPCGHDVPCRNYHCDHDAICVARGGQPKCQCPFCSEEYDPVCGSDGMTYGNECKMREENCERKTNFRQRHKGTCNGCENVKCEFHAVCESFGNKAECVCPTSCVDVESKVCGSDGRTYQNECELKVAACRNRQFITVASGGDCGTCAGTVCNYGAKCENGRCVCPILCRTDHEPICASNGKTYSNECEMRRASCSRKIELEVTHSGECDDSIVSSGSGEGSGDEMESCDESKCRFGGSCVLDTDGTYSCSCNFNCAAVRSPVCGSDGKTYGNECHLRFEACHQQHEILIQPMDNCDDVGPEEPCDGSLPLVNQLTGQDYDCGAGHEVCPAGSYCHLGFSKCCQEEFSIEHCKDTKYGCCQDKQTASPGPKGAGCPEICHCNAHGSYGFTCDPQTRQCTCKPGVGGLRCDRCDPGYWGIHKIQEKGNVGCIPCNCNPYGSIRDDCDQMTGRCMCKPTISGMKCNMCADNNLLGPTGCDATAVPVPKSCYDLNCQHGSVCQERNGHLVCVCEVQFCKGNDDDQDIVCGTDGQNYGSECQLLMFGCRLQKDISVAYSGPCQAEPSTRTTTAMPFTTRSRKTTRHISETRGPPPPLEVLTKGTDRPAIPEPQPSCGPMGLIDQLCLKKTDCCVSNSRCRLGLCSCLPHYVPSIDNTQCIEVIKKNPGTPPTSSPNTDACTNMPCHNGGTCEIDVSLGFRCVCPLGKTGPFCKQDNFFSVPSFTGMSYLKVPRIRHASKDLNIEVVFQTLNRDGIILYNSQNDDGTGDFISLSVKNRHVEFRFDLGGGEAVVRSTNPVTLKHSHRVVARRVQETGLLIMDNEEPVSGASVHTHTSLNLQDPLYVGYVPNAYKEVYRRIGVDLGLVGCIHSLKAGNKDTQHKYSLAFPDPSTDITDGADIGECGSNPCKSMPCRNDGTCIMLDQINYQCFCKDGYQGLLCQELTDPCASQPCQHGGTCERSQIDTGYECICADGRDGLRCEKESMKRVYIPQFTGDSYIQLALSENVGRKLTIEIWFKTLKPNGVILFASQFKGGLGDFISLNLVKRKLQFRFFLGGGTAMIESRKHIPMRKWHRVVIHRFNQKGEMTINKGPTVRGDAPGEMTELNLGRPLYIGGYIREFDLPPGAEIKYNFTGAIQRVIINGKTIDSLMESAEKIGNIEEYNGPPCNINPCMNGGICIPQLNSADCRCPLNFMGERCEKRAEHVDKDQPIKFDGNTFLQYPNEIRSRQQAQRNNNIRIKFRTKEKNGLLAFQNKGKSVMGDYFAIAIRDGKLEMSYNLGKNSEKNLHILRSSTVVNDDDWHRVVVKRELREGSLQLDEEEPITSVSTEGASQLDTDGELWIGGKKNLPWGLPASYYSGFMGCIDEISINREEMHLVEDRDGHGSTIAFCT